MTALLWLLGWKIFVHITIYSGVYRILLMGKIKETKSSSAEKGNFIGEKNFKVTWKKVWSYWNKTINISKIKIENSNITFSF